MSKSNNSRFTSFVFTVNNYTPEDLNRINDSNWNSVFDRDWETSKTRIIRFRHFLYYV